MTLRFLVLMELVSFIAPIISRCVFGDPIVVFAQMEDGSPVKKKKKRDWLWIVPLLGVKLSWKPLLK